MPRAPSATAARQTPSGHSQRQHWIVDVARRAKLANSETLIIPATLSTQDAWAKACEVCRIREEEMTRHVADYFKLPLAKLSGAEGHALTLIP